MKVRPITNITHALSNAERNSAAPNGQMNQPNCLAEQQKSNKILSKRKSGMLLTARIVLFQASQDVD